jgi:hypothetical protein
MDAPCMMRFTAAAAADARNHLSRVTAEETADIVRRRLLVPDRPRFSVTDRLAAMSKGALGLGSSSIYILADGSALETNPRIQVF